MTNRPKGVLFDLDGTLIDSTYVHAVCWWEAFRQHGLAVPMATIGRAVGMGADVLIEHVLGKTPDDADAITEAHGVLYRTYWDRLRPLPGVRDLIRTCAEREARVVIASSGAADDVARMRLVLDCDDYLCGSTSSADADSSKPNPDIVSATLEQAGLHAQDSVFVGDAVWDVDAAARAGVACIGVATGVFSQAELAEAGAIATFADAGELHRYLDRTSGDAVTALTAGRG